MLSRRDILALFSAGPALAWQQAEFSTGVSVVNLLATAVDKAGKFVNDLTQDDFTIEEDGAVRSISYFGREDGLALNLGLLVDVSASQTEILQKELRASVAFFNQVLREDRDRGYLIRFGGEVELVQDLTASRQQLEAAVGKVLTDIGSRRQTGGTVLFDALYFTARGLTKMHQRRKAVIVLSDGVDTTSVASLADAVEMCQRADTVIYSIRMFDSNFGYNLAEGKKALQRISEKTGGGYFEVSRKQPLEAIYRMIDEELRSQYNIGFVPPAGAPGFHKLRATVSRKGVVVRTREGYYSGG